MIVLGASQPIHLSQWDRLKDLIFHSHHTSRSQAWWQELRELMLRKSERVLQPLRQLRAFQHLTSLRDLCSDTPPTRPQRARVTVVGEVPCDDMVQLGTLVVPPPRRRTWRHQFTLCVMHEIVKECVHFRHAFGIRLRITLPGAICTRVEIAPQEDALVFTLCDTFG